MSSVFNNNNNNNNNNNKDRIAHTMAFVECWLEWEIDQWVHHEGSILQTNTPWADALPWSVVSLKSILISFDGAFSF